MKLTRFLTAITCLMAASQDKSGSAALACAPADMSGSQAVETAVTEAAETAADAAANAAAVHADGSEDDKRAPWDICTLSPQMSAALKDITDRWQSRRREQALDAGGSNLTSQLIAWAGVRRVLDFLPGSLEEYRSESSDNNGLDLVVMVNLNEEYITLICNLLHSMGAACYRSMTQEQRRTAPEIDGWSDSDRAECICLAVNSSNISTGSHDRPWLCDLSAADARNSSVAGRRILCAAPSTENTDTLGLKSCRIDNKELMQSLVNHTFDYVQAHATELQIAIDADGHAADILTRVLSELDRSDYVSNPYSLARFAAEIITGMQEAGSTDQIEKIIGKSMQVLSFPADSFMFSKTGRKSQSWHASTMAAVLKNRSCFREGRDSKGADLDFQAMAENYITSFCSRSDVGESLQPGDCLQEGDLPQPGDRLTPGGHALIRNWLSALNTRDSDALSRAYELLCTLEWEDVLEPLLGSSDHKKSGKKLWTETVEYIGEHTIDSDDDITPEEEAEIKRRFPKYQSDG